MLSMRDKLVRIVSLILVLACISGANRSTAAKNAFKRANPCPVTQSSKGPCPGYVVDHIIPLCAGGPDKPHNMQWQTVENAKIKDRDERRMCKR